MKAVMQSEGQELLSAKASTNWRGKVQELRMRHLCEHVGRSDFTGNYRSSEKQEERERVADFILSATPDFKRVKLLSMPGLHWSFETLMLHRRGGTHLVGLERSVSTYLRSKREMPTSYRITESAKARRIARNFGHISERVRKFGRAEYMYSRCGVKPLSGRETSAHRLLCLSSSVYSTMLITDYGQSSREREEFYARFCSRNAVWLDYTSQICAEVEETLRALPVCLAPNERKKPVVVTILNARDSLHGAAARVAHIQRVQPALQVEEHWTYKGFNDAPMLTVCGTML